MESCRLAVGVPPLGETDGHYADLHQPHIYDLTSDPVQGGRDDGQDVGYGS